MLFEYSIIDVKIPCVSNFPLFFFFLNFVFDRIFPSNGQLEGKKEEEREKKKERREAQGREEREPFERSLGNSRRSSTVVVALPPRSLCLSREVFFSSFFLGLNHFGFGGREEGERERERERESNGGCER